MNEEEDELRCLNLGSLSKLDDDMYFVKRVRIVRMMMTLWQNHQRMMLSCMDKSWLPIEWMKTTTETLHYSGQQHKTIIIRTIIIIIIMNKNRSLV